MIPTNILLPQVSKMEGQNLAGNGGAEKARDAGLAEVFENALKAELPGGSQQGEAEKAATEKAGAELMAMMMIPQGQAELPKSVGVNNPAKVEAPLKSVLDPKMPLKAQGPEQAALSPNFLKNAEGTEWGSEIAPSEMLSEEAVSPEGIGFERDIPAPHGLQILEVKGAPKPVMARVQKEGVARTGVESVAVEQGLPSRVSTEDFLALRDLKKEKSIRTMGSALAPAALAGQELKSGSLHLGPSLEAPVTQGTAGHTVLSHDAIHQITQQVNLMSQAKQDGEIKIRLKPDHLGELLMNVKASGKQISIEIKTKDLESKRIIEESLGRLKDSLAVQSLSLARVEVVNQPQMHSPMDGALNFDFNQGQGGAGHSNFSSNHDSSSGGRQEFLFDEHPDSGSLESMRPIRGRRGSGTGGLDLIAS